MGDEVTKRDLQLVQSQIALMKKELASVNKLVGDVVTALGARVTAAEKQLVSMATVAMVLEGDKVAESKVAPVRASIAALEQRVKALE
jgi:hypothetical protein